ncbi:hypothetical protein ACGFR8_12275 [Streptomyces brevispora]|uniref:hypothetical protein n=1 Tax=Streptomyces brevispora TaxID=887462 RepID=UPI0037242C8D
MIWMDRTGRIEWDAPSLGATRIGISPLRDSFRGLYPAIPHCALSRPPYEGWVVRVPEVLWEDDSQL